MGFPRRAQDAASQAAQHLAHLDDSAEGSLRSGWSHGSSAYGYGPQGLDLHERRPRYSDEVGEVSGRRARSAFGDIGRNGHDRPSQLAGEAIGFVSGETLAKIRDAGPAS